MIDTLFINPPSDNKHLLKAIEPPIWTAMFAQYFRLQNQEVAIIDAEAENLDLPHIVKQSNKMEPKQVIISVLGITPSASSTPKMPIASQLATLLKNENHSVYMAGLHPTALAEETVLACDIDGVIRGTPFGFVYPAWDLLPMDKYRAHNWHCLHDIDNRGHYASIYTSFGCPFKCSYCNIHSLYINRPRVEYFDLNQVIEVVDDLVQKYGVRNLKIADEIFGFREDRVCQFCRMIIERGYKLNIWCYARLDTITTRMLEHMANAGIKWIGYGFESASERIRKGVAKTYTSDIEKQAVEATRYYGINIMANYIFGLPGDDKESMQATLDSAKKYNFEFVNLYVAMPYPGSKMYNEARRKGWALPDTWDAYGQFSPNCAPLGTYDMSPQQVVAFKDRAFKDYFDRPEYLNMVQKKFGDKALCHIKEMVKMNIKRNP